MPSFVGSIDEGRMLVDIWVSVPGQNGDENAPPVNQFQYRALLDTGATISGISKKVVSEMNLIPDGWLPITGAHGKQDTPTCSVGMVIPVSEQATVSMRGFEKMKVMVMDFQPEGFDVIIGMDLLHACHLSMSNGVFMLSI